MSESGDWYCRNCGYITSARVTHSETCDQCHIPVEWHDAEQQDELTTLRARVQELEAKVEKIQGYCWSRVNVEHDGPQDMDVCIIYSFLRYGDDLPTPPEDKSDG